MPNVKFTSIEIKLVNTDDGYTQYSQTGPNNVIGTPDKKNPNKSDLLQEIPEKKSDDKKESGDKN